MKGSWGGKKKLVKANEDLRQREGNTVRYKKEVCQTGVPNLGRDKIRGEGRGG